jgi:hypothetical protein
MKSNTDANSITLNKFLRSIIMKGMSYVQTMLQIMKDADTLSIEDVKYKLSVERERYQKKLQEQLMKGS